ncbi:MAG: YgiQ family radical SAM protein, partial [bacterium]|nr:YgiQ family radical SAM protein [bacterium]
MSKFDIIFVLPYLFSDHPSFPEGILKRALEAGGFSVGVIETPSWQKPESFSRLGAPRLFFAIIPGPVDSVVLNYTSTRKRRREDLYQKNGNAFFEGCPPSIKHKIRPDHTVVVFAN